MLDIVDHYGYSLAAGYAAKQQTIKAIVRCSSEIGSITFKHDDEQWLAEKASLSQGAQRRNPLAAKCVGALDGLAIEIQKPTSEFSPKQFSNRKGFYAICCQAVCDAQNRFLLFDCSSPGSTHDSVAFSRTPLFSKLQQGLQNNYWVAADSAYPLVGSLMKPFPGKARCDLWEDSFNYHLSSLRISIENTFGIFIQRWGILWRALRCDPVEATKILVSCASLHNFIIDIDGIDRALQLIEQQKHHYFLVFHQDELNTQPQHPTIQSSSSDGGGSSLRAAMVQQLSSLGVLRPPLLEQTHTLIKYFNEIIYYFKKRKIN